MNHGSNLKMIELSAFFNKVSDKVICFEEYEQKEKSLMKENLTLREKAFYVFDDLHQAFNMISTFRKFKQEAGQMTAYIDPAIPSAAIYIPAKELAEMELIVYSEGLNNEFQEKVLKLRLQALEECVDHNARVKSGELKPTK
jgi:hypothetical protein